MPAAKAENAALKKSQKLSERREKVRRSVWVDVWLAAYIQTGSSSGLAVNHCTTTMAPKGTSHVDLLPRKDFSRAHCFGDKGRLLLPQ